MGIFSKPKPPKVDSYQNVAGQQQNLNLEMMQKMFGLTAANQINPYGGLTYTQDPTTGQYTARQQLSPEQQQLLDYLQGTQASAGQQGQALLAGANYGAQPDFSTQAGALTREQMDAYTAYNQPYYDKQTAALDTTLRNQGLVPGTPAYNNQMRELRDTQSREVSMASAQFEPQAFQQAVQQYQMPAAMAQQLAQFGAPGSVMQNLWGTPQASGQPANLIGAYQGYNQAANQQYQNQMEQYSGMLKGIFGIGGALAGNMAIPGFGPTSAGGVGGGG